MLYEVITDIASSLRSDIKSIAYEEIQSSIKEGKTFIKFDGIEYGLSIFGGHNLQNLNGARLICNELGISDENFLESISSFKGSYNFV